MFSKRRSEAKLVEADKRFNMMECLGSGAFASVYKAIDRKDQKACAIKKIALNQNTASQPLTEYLIGKSCNHANVVKTLGCLETPDYIYIQLELVDGGDLFTHLDPSGPGLPEAKARRLSIELAEGIAFLHSKDIVHADLKPENVLVHQGKIKICDFGLAGYKGTERLGKSTGTGAYMSPELVNRKSVDSYHLREAHDVWAFGIIMYAILFADLPWGKARLDDEDFALYCSKGGVSSKLYPFCNVTKLMRALLSKCLAIKASSRPSMARVARFLQQDFSWHEGGQRKKITSYGLREAVPQDSRVLGNETIHVRVRDSEDSAEDFSDAGSSVSDSSSVPSIHDAEVATDDKYTAKPKRDTNRAMPAPYRHGGNTKHGTRNTIVKQPMPTRDYLPEFSDDQLHASSLDLTRIVIC